MKLDKKVLKALILESLNEVGAAQGADGTKRGEGRAQYFKKILDNRNSTEEQKEKARKMLRLMGHLAPEPSVKTEADLKSIPGGGEGSGIATGQLSDVKQAMNEIEMMMDKFQKLKDSIEQIYQRELAKKNSPILPQTDSGYDEEAEREHELRALQAFGDTDTE